MHSKAVQGASSQATEFAYRHDIDGLRALAVLPVIAFHMGVQVLRGGFIGVDIFFVVSGYLISSKIIHDLEREQFSISKFYIRRVKRIMPALVLMMLITSILAATFSYPDEFQAYAHSLIAAVASVSNIYFWQSQDYFAAGRPAPLLHTWSLSVEEQFYIILPPVLIFVYRYCREKLIHVICAFLTISLIAASVDAFRNPSFAFYLPHTRIWEFLIGTLLVRARLKPLDRPLVRESAAALGFILIVGSVFVVDKRMPFPGLVAIPPCLGAALIIAAGSRGVNQIGKLLSSFPLRWIGVLSYSLYLWHWPFIVFFKEAKPTQFLSLGDKAILSIIILLAAYCSWRFIEQPFRRSTAGGRRVFATVGAVFGMVLIFGSATVLSKGFRNRFSGEEQRLTSYQQDAALPRSEGCFGRLRDKFSDLTPNTCLQRDSTRPDVLLVGDSHANHLWGGLNETKSVNVLELTVNGCPPLLTSLSSDDPLCRQTTRYLLDVLAHNPADAILLSARWQKDMIPEVERMVVWLKSRGLAVILSGPVPEYDAELPKLLAIAERRRDAQLPHRHLVASVKETDAMLERLAARQSVRYLSPYRALCPQIGTCKEVTRDGAVMQSDYGHLTSNGSRYVVSEMLKKKPLLPVKVS